MAETPPTNAMGVCDCAPSTVVVVHEHELLLLAASLSQRLGALTPADVARVATLLQRAGLRTTAPQIGAGKAADFMRIDKKVQGGRVRLVLLAHLGEA